MSISIAQEFQKYLKFYCNGVLYKVMILCFGLACAPRRFTKVFKPTFAFVRSRGIMAYYYIDDSLVTKQLILLYVLKIVKFYSNFLLFVVLKLIMKSYH